MNRLALIVLLSTITACATEEAPPEATPEEMEQLRDACHAMSSAQLLAGSCAPNGESLHAACDAEVESVPCAVEAATAYECLASVEWQCVDGFDRPLPSRSDACAYQLDLLRLCLEDA